MGMQGLKCSARVLSGELGDHSQEACWLGLCFDGCLSRPAGNVWLLTRVCFFFFFFLFCRRAVQLHGTLQQQGQLGILCKVARFELSPCTLSHAGR